MVMARKWKAVYFHPVCIWRGRKKYPFISSEMVQFFLAISRVAAPSERKSFLTLVFFFFFRLLSSMFLAKH